MRKKTLLFKFFVFEKVKSLQSENIIKIIYMKFKNHIIGKILKKIIHSFFLFFHKEYSLCSFKEIKK